MPDGPKVGFGTVVEEEEGDHPPSTASCFSLLEDVVDVISGDFCSNLVFELSFRDSCIESIARRLRDSCAFTAGPVPCTALFVRRSCSVFDSEIASKRVTIDVATSHTLESSARLFWQNRSFL